MTCRHAILWFDGGDSQDGSCPAEPQAFPRATVMTHYLVRARAKPEKLDELAQRLAADAFVDLEPFGRALTRGLRGARVEGDGVIWEEADYCSPPLAEERAAVLDAYFEDLAVEAVAKDEGWRRVAALPLLFPELERAAGRRT
jgi:hypothetical protein